MSGTKYLLDTNFILGILKSDVQVLEELSSRRMLAGECSYSAITRMELLGFHLITQEEESLIKQKLEHFDYLPLTKGIEDAVISLRQVEEARVIDTILSVKSIAATPVRHQPSARIAGMGKILADILSPAALIEDWNCAK